MQGKGLVKFFLVLLAIVCLWQYMLLLPTRSVEKAADSYAESVAAKSASADKTAALKEARNRFLDSVSSTEVFNIPYIKRYTYEDLKKSQLALGLDLKGGMSVLLQVDLRDFLVAMAAYSTDADFNKALDQAKAKMTNAQADYITLFRSEFEAVAPSRKLAEIFVRNETLKGAINIESSNAQVVQVLRDRANETVGQTFNRLKERIDELGVVQPNISLDKARDIIVVELPGIDNPERARKMLQSQAKLEFWEVYRNNDPGVLAAFQQADNLLKASASVTPDTSKVDTSAMNAGPLLKALALTQFNPNGGTAMIGVAPKSQIETINGYLNQPNIRALFPRDLEFRWGNKVNVDADGKPLGTYTLYCVKRGRSNQSGAALEGEHVTDANTSFDQQGGQGVAVNLKMDGEGARTWYKVTTQAANDNQREVAILLDDKVVSAPSVRQPIAGGSSEITGGFTMQEGQDLANILKVGKLPARTQIIQESIVGPSLGEENINKGLRALLISLLAIIVFMAWYYSGGGWVANIALVANLFFIIGALTSFGTVLTLPGMAGIVLTMGMAVDANVIIYERIREELRAGKALAIAVSEGFKHSMSAILDGNLTTLLTAIVLIYFGIGPIKGFGVVLSVGIVFTLFTAVLFSRLITEWWMSRGNNIKFYSAFTEKVLDGFNTDWMGLRKKAYLFSTVIVLAGIVSMFVRGFEFGVDFKGGFSYNVQFDKEISADALRTNLTAAFGGESTIVKAVNTANTYNITTSYMSLDTSQTRENKVVEQLISGVAKTTGSTIDPTEFSKTDGKGIHIVSKTSVGPTVADDIQTSAIWATIAGLLVIFLYILLRFNRWQYSVGAIIATGHDALVVLGLFSLLHGILPFSMEVDQAFIAAILTIIGYSINDTVIVYDRIREYMRMYTKKPMGEVINDAINTTLRRTVVTSFTVFLVVLILFLFGGAGIRGFSFALLIGVAYGTYSSIFIAAPIMMDLSKNLDLSEKPVSTSDTVLDEEEGKGKRRKRSSQAS